LTEQERQRLQRELTTWYYRDGNGMLLGRSTRLIFLNAKHNLTGKPAELKPRTICVLCDTEPAQNLALLPVACSRVLQPGSPQRGAVPSRQRIRTLFRRSDPDEREAGPSDPG
jgi:hypothetical protein